MIQVMHAVEAARTSCIDLSVLKEDSGHENSVRARACAAPDIVDSGGVCRMSRDNHVTA